MATADSSTYNRTTPIQLEITLPFQERSLSIISTYIKNPFKRPSHLAVTSNIHMDDNTQDYVACLNISFKCHLLYTVYSQLAPFDSIRQVLLYKELRIFLSPRTSQKCQRPGFFLLHLQYYRAEVRTSLPFPESVTICDGDRF